MSGSAQGGALEGSQSLLYWFHVPLETLVGDYLGYTGSCVAKNQDGLVGTYQVLGRSADLHFVSAGNSGDMLARPTSRLAHYLLFSKITEQEAESILKELKDKMPAAAYKLSAGMRVGASPIVVSGFAKYDGKIPTLIPSHLTPEPSFDAPEITSFLDPSEMLEMALGNVPSVTDHRIMAAIDLEIAARYEFMPRSKFLTYMTIIDSLAAHGKRSPEVCTWLDEKRKEAEQFGDGGIVSALGNLKNSSHGMAVKDLVKRCGEVLGLEYCVNQANIKRVGKLYGMRSSLSHAGENSSKIDVQGAEYLARMVIKAAIQQPSVLDLDAYERPKRSAVGSLLLNVRMISKCTYRRLFGRR